MATMEEIKDYTNGIIASQNLDAFCFIQGSNIIIRLVGQYNRNQIEHLVNQYTEITDYIIQSKGAYVDIFYIYS